MNDLAQIRTRAHDSLGKKKAGGEFLVVTGRAHGDGDRVLSDPDFQRLFDRYLIGDAFITAIRFAAHDAAGADAVKLSGRGIHAE